MAESLSDATLLDRFVNAREEAAFAALVRRHGPRVERICRRILRDEQDAEDVLQATFLVLARKASGIGWGDSVSPWIDGVARRLALHARTDWIRRRGRERPVTVVIGGPGGGGRIPERFHPAVEPSGEVERRDLRRVLDDELARLPEKYRAPVVLCDLEGHTHEEAARRLGWPAGSISRRLDRARGLLRRRLTGRGVALGVLGLACLAVALLSGRRVDRSDASTPVRDVMAAFEAGPGRGESYEAILAAAARGRGSRPDFGRILPAARTAIEAAGRIEGHDPGREADDWHRLAAEMADSAAELERACERSDAPALLSAARRLEASCVQCHTAFRRGPMPASAPRSGRTSRRLRPPDRSGPIIEPGRSGVIPPPPVRWALRSPALRIDGLAANVRGDLAVQRGGLDRGSIGTSTGFTSHGQAPYQAFWPDRRGIRAGPLSA